MTHPFLHFPSTYTIKQAPSVVKPNEDRIPIRHANSAKITVLRQLKYGSGIYEVFFGWGV